MNLGRFEATLEGSYLTCGARRWLLNMGAAQRAARVFNDMCLTRTAADPRRGFDA